MSEFQAENKALMHYPFGMLMPGRNFGSETYSTDSYRYGFNGKENDDEVKGAGNSLDFGARIYNSRLGKWLSVDKASQRYPTLSPFIYAGNIPIILFDEDGNSIFIKGDINQLISDLQAMFGSSVIVSEKDGFLEIQKVGELNYKLSYVYDRLHTMISDTRYLEVKVSKGTNLDDYNRGVINSESIAKFDGQENQTSQAGMFLHFFEEQFYKQAILGLDQVTIDPTDPSIPNPSYDEAHPIAMASEFNITGMFRGNQEIEITPNGVIKYSWELFDKERNYLGTENTYFITNSYGEYTLLKTEMNIDQSKAGQKVSFTSDNQKAHFEKAIDLLNE